MDYDLARYELWCSILPDASGLGTADAHNSFVGAHDGRCAICWSPTTRLLLDHDHRTGFVRGLLCHSCNMRTPSDAHHLRLADCRVPVIARYIQHPPASVMNLREIYEGAWNAEPDPDLWKHIWHAGPDGWWREKDDLFRNNAAARVGL